MPKITDPYLHLLKLCRKNRGLFFPDTVQFLLSRQFTNDLRYLEHLLLLLLSGVYVQPLWQSLQNNAPEAQACSTVYGHITRFLLHADIHSRNKGRKVKADITLSGEPHQSSDLRDVTCHMGSYSVTCHPTQVNAPRLTQPCRLVFDLPTPEGCKAEMTQLT